MSSEGDSSSMFIEKYDTKESRRLKSATNSRPSTPNSLVDGDRGETITVKDFFDFMRTAYQVYENLEDDNDDEFNKINWEELTKLTVINHVIEQVDRDLLSQTVSAVPQPVVSKSDSCLKEKCEKNDVVAIVGKRLSCSQIEGKRKFLPSSFKVEMLGVWTETNLNCKLNDILNEGILDSILPYLVGYKKPTKTTSAHTPLIKTSNMEVKKRASFGTFVNEKESKDRLGRRKSSVAAAQERLNQKHEGDVEIHVCDEVKGMKKDFRCPQKLLISKMGYFADVTAGQRLEDMDISVHCDIQIFDWLMRWVKRDTILVEDWPLLNPHNVVPILVSASFLQMEPLLHDCLIYCHAHMSEIVNTSTNLSCLSDALLTRLAAMYTNVELESLKDRKDKMQSRLYCKMILSLAEPVPETLRGHYATLATLFKCSKCNKLVGRHLAEQVPCQPAHMRIDRRGNLLSTHTRDPSWSLNEYITWLYGELRSWRRVYWRLWADCHFLKCQLCDSYFPAYQMEWCCYHAQAAQMFVLEGRAGLPAGRYPCCGERAYRFETLTRNTGCQFRAHVPDECRPADGAVVEVYARFRDMVAMPPPHLMFPDRVTRLVGREGGFEYSGRLECKETFWWEGIQLVPPRPTLGLLGKIYTSNNKFNQSARPGTPLPVAGRGGGAGQVPAQSQSAGAGAGAGAPPLPPSPPSPPSPLATPTPLPTPSPSAATPSDTETARRKDYRPKTGKIKKKGVAGASGGGDSGSEERLSSSESEQSSESDRSDEDAPPKRPVQRIPIVQHNSKHSLRPARVSGRQWAVSASARSNQDAQRRYEERAARQMRAALARRNAAHAHKHNMLPGGIYARLEAEWRERVGGGVGGGNGGGGAGGGGGGGVPRLRHAPSGRARAATNAPRQGRATNNAT